MLNNTKKNFFKTQSSYFFLFKNNVQFRFKILLYPIDSQLVLTRVLVEECFMDYGSMETSTLKKFHKNAYCVDLVYLHTTVLAKFQKTCGFGMVLSLNNCRCFFKRSIRQSSHFSKL